MTAPPFVLDFVFVLVFDVVFVQSKTKTRTKSKTKTKSRWRADVPYGLNRYPMPRTVSRWRGLSASSPMCARSRATKLSTVRAVPK